MSLLSSRSVIMALFFGVLMLVFPPTSFASSDIKWLDLTDHFIGYLSLILFVLAYALVVAEEAIHLSKSKPVLIVAGIIWIMIAAVYARQADATFHTAAADMIRHNLLEYIELLLFLLVAMTYINTMEERGVFAALRSWLINQDFSLRSIFWFTGILAFCISPIADNLTTALLMATVVMAVGGSNHKFVVLACISIVISANAGGAFSPFGDITTLMVWQKGILEFHAFFALLIPALINWLIPAILISIAIPNGKPSLANQKVTIKKGAFIVTCLFLLTISITVYTHHFFHLPPAIGMMSGLGLLTLYGYTLKIGNKYSRDDDLEFYAPSPLSSKKNQPSLDIFHQLGRIDWDTLMFFYGIMLCVGGLGAIGYLTIISEFMYGSLGATTTNILIGILSALVDNIPVMFAVLSMMPDMNSGEWLLVTLTAGVGGSLLSIGSAAGVAVMGQARGIYTFFAHLKWIWAIALGYAASIWVHIWLNADLFI